MSEILTAAQMRACEMAEIESGAVTGLELMERAGAGVVEAIFAQWPEFSPGRAIVLCGPGNNGGDGYVIARLLAERGWSVDCHAFGDPSGLPADARTNHDRWKRMGAVHPWDDSAIAARIDSLEGGLVIDALFGTGLTRALPEQMDQTGRAIATRHSAAPADARPHLVAVDIPSGISSDSGRDLGGALPADLTVTFHRAKCGHYLDPRSGPSRPAGGATLSGRIAIVDIGLPQTPLPDAAALITAPTHSLAKGSGGHKYGHGHALVLSGRAGKGGAARLAARAALRIGAGLVTLACPQAALPENAAQLNAVMLTPLPDAYALRGLMKDERLNALCLGPGLGAARAQEMVPAALWGKRATVLDADALTAFESDPELLFGQLHPDCVLTPHLGEFARLFPDLAGKLSDPDQPGYSKLDATREAAARAGCTVLLKGPDTAIATQDSRVALHSATGARAAPWLATAGSGDVLAGLIAGLLARGATPFDAACSAAWLHAEAARSFGPGLIAEDLPEELPRVLRGLAL
ncbi:bifunctional ADP-dependent NAD(P)H-hydrate dehydratase/NAD(P)H-hydrate epimerase [Thioclava atlantica]|uniref:Bifunctional NAD(P)H-hydrate repair enzyme n=1 Tax=Thioclava atlantica TaxID=1317124 RepID=A0A085U058_9RHOB|nr:bifunctional ADP-dependent NAD(P)H-hydrate dehydratase/NAD(P)H-hydrate epimerase [Thioclava atlantica]KFE36355.1 yjeF-like protein [Thioclava atlantica]